MSAVTTTPSGAPLTYLPATESSKCPFNSPTLREYLFPVIFVLDCCCREQQLWERQQALLDRMQQQWDSERQVSTVTVTGGCCDVTAAAAATAAKHSDAIPLLISDLAIKHIVLTTMV
jgi:hypothetical protein